MAWQPPEDELDSNVLQQWKPPEDELDENISNQWSPPEDELDNSPKKIKDVGTLNQMKASGQELTREQERILWDADERKPLTQKASEVATNILPAAIDVATKAGKGTAELVYHGILKPLDTMSQSPEEAEKTLKKAKNTLRSFASGVGQDIQEMADAAVRFGMFGSAITDKLLGKTDDERFERYMLRESMRQFSQKVYEDNPDHAARLLAENPILQKMAYAAALAQGGTPEEAELAKKAYSELVLESGLTKEEINENVSLIGEILSPVAFPGTNRVTKIVGKITEKATQKTGELALKGVVAPVARGVAKAAGKVEAGAEQVQQLSRKIGEYAVGDPDTLVKNAANTAMMPIRIPAKTTGGIAKTVADVAGEAGYGRRGMFERAGRKADAGELTKRLFGPEALGGKGRARMADWAVRQTNAIVQPAVNGSIINIVMGLPDIESGADLGFMAGTGAGIGAFGGSRFQDRAMALVDPTTSLAQKIDAIVTPDPAAYRKDQDADIKRFLATADTSLLDSINELSNIDNIKSALDVKIKNLEGKKIAQIRDEDAQRIQENIDLLSKQREELDKTTPQTEAEIKRQIQLSFADAMDLAKTTGAAAGLNNIEVKVLKPEQMEDFYRERYGKNLIDAEAVRRELIGNPTLSPSEQELLTKADETILRFLNDLAGASNARGFAVAERPDMPGQKGATIVINGDLVTQMGRDGLNISRVINHEMQHALANFTEVRQMLAPLRQELFDQKIQNPDGSFEFVSKGMISDAQLDAYALQYAAGMDASGGTSFLSHFADQNQVREYMKEEVLSELAGLSGASHGDIRAGLDSVGRQAVDWLETKTRSGALKRIKEGLRQFGVLVDDQGQFTSVLGANFSPEALAMMRQYQRKLRDLNESLVYNSDPRKDEPAIPITELATNRAFQQRYKDSEFFEQEQVISMQAPDGSKQEIPVPVNAELNPLVGSYTFADGQLVDDSGNVVSFGPDVALQAMPDGTVVTLDTRVARNPNGSPRILSPHETKRRAKERGNAIREVIDNAPDDGSGVRLEDTGNGNYRGTLSPTQIAAINALPNDVVAPSLKRKIAFFNDILGRKDGTIVEIEYQAALRDGKYRALKPQLRTEIPIGFQFDKQGNFLMTTMSISRMYDKANAWAAKSPRNLRLWGGDMTKFWDSVRQYTLNHQEGVQGHIGLHSDPYIAMRMKNRINDLFNVYRKETREANPERTTLPKRRGQDSRDVIIRSRRMDRVNSYDETALAKMPFQYELAVQNYLPAENPLADFQSAEQFAKATEVDQNLVNRAIAGDIESLEVELSNEDVLRPMEYVDVNDNKIRIRSMFDPTQGFLLEPEESAPEMPAVQFMPAETIEAPSGERGFKSKLQMEIQGKFRGAMATPEQLKAVVNNPQNVKAEEVKWSGVNDAIDRLASENNGKVPVQELLNYLRDEGQVKFEEVNIKETSRDEIPSSWLQQRQEEILREQAKEIADQDDSNEEDVYDSLIRNASVLQETMEQAREEYLDKEQGLMPKFASLVLPGGENYREVVMAMPIGKGISKQKAIQLRDQSWSKIEQLPDFPTGTNPLYQVRWAEENHPELYAEWSDFSRAAGNKSSEVNKDAYTSSHFPDVPNYVAHMRLNERTDAEGNDGLFMEELQSDRHQAGREKGYNEDLDVARREELRNKEGSLTDAEMQELGELNSKALGQGIPDAPFRRDWSLQLFKRALRDAVESGKQWIGWTTGDTQAERYDLSKQLSQVEWYPYTNEVFGYDKNGNKVINTTATEQTLPDVVGKELAQKLIESEPYQEGQKILKGLDLKVGGEGMKGFYDQILPKEIGKYVGKMGGKVEKSEIETLKGKPTDYEDFNAYKNAPETKQTSIWRVNITPEMANVVSAGQIQFMPAEVDTRYIDLEAKAKNFSNPDDFIKSQGRKLFHFSEFKKPTFSKEGGRFSGNISTFEEKDLPRYPQRERYLVELYLDGKILDAAGDTDLTPFNIINRNGDNVEFNEMIKTASKSVGVNKEPYVFPWNSDDWLGKTGETWRKTLQEELAKKGYVGYQPGAEIVITDPSAVKTKDQLIDIWNKSQKSVQFLPAEQGEPEGLQGIELPTQYRRISDMIPPLRDIEPPVRPVVETKPLGEIEIGNQTPEIEEQIIEKVEKVPVAKEEIPVAKVEPEDEVADKELVSTGIEVPESVDEQSVISNAIRVANSKPWKKGRDFKLDIQQRVLEAAEKAGVKISERTLETIEYLTRVGLKDGLIALEQNPNAIGWYDEKTKQALGVMSLLFPEIATDENARFAFTWALAVTSNGLKVDKNFELAEKVYRAYRKTGKMPSNIQAGQAQGAINQSLELFNQLTKEWGIENTRKFMQTEFTVQEISRLGVVNNATGNDIKPGGEYADTTVRGASILGPKIGNGFFSNLYGLFDALTMDRWLVRTWGRWTGTLVELNQELTQQATTRMQEAVTKLTTEDKARFDQMIGKDVAALSSEELAVAIQKASMKPKLRDVMNQTETGEELRKSGNGLAKYLDGQKEAPASPAERNFIREIFGLMLDELKSDPKYADLTMADLQAVLWYAEKRLYETAKIKADQDSVDSADADGYEDADAPDYANAAIGVAREKGVSEKRIKEVLEKIKNDRTTTTRLATEGRGEDQTGEQKSAGGFVGREKQKFQHYVAVSTARRNRTGNAKALWTYSRGSGKDSGDAGVLKPKSKKNLGVKYISEWKPGRKLATMFKNNGLPPVKFLELDSTDKQSAQKFADTLQQSKNASVNGAAVYVYPAEDYQGMKLFIAESGKSGFAIKPDGDIVSVFSMEKGSGRSVMEAAIASGGKKLDAFDTILPEFYGEHGFVEAARIPWNDEFSPEGWNKDTFKKFNNGEPDVVMMVLDPKYTGDYTPRTDIYATDYDTAVQMQDALLQKIEKSGKKK